MSTIEFRTLGQGLKVPAIGLGCMGMSHGYGPASDKDSLIVLSRALELGVNFWDTAEIYGPFTNELLLGKALKTVPREKLIIATKFGWEFNDKNERTILNGSAKHIKQSVEGSLKRLGTDYIDLYYQHRVDPNVSIEETVGAMSDLVREGKIRHIGLSEASASTIKRAHKLHPITAVQSEYSLWERSAEESVLPTLKELGIGFVAYSPIGRGLLTGTIRSLDDLAADDSRRKQPRFQGENLKNNLELVDEVLTLGKSVNASPSQIAIAWVLRQDKNIVPIPGTKRLQYLEENTASANLKISDEQWKPLERKLESFKASGMRYTPDNMKLIDH